MKKITPVPNGPLVKKKGQFKGSTLKAGGTIKKAQVGVSMTKRDSIKAANKARIDSTLNARAKKFGFNTQEEYFNWQKQRSKGSDQPAGDACKKGSDKPSKCAVNLKAGGMIKAKSKK